jgi:2'-5' RNA ligase
VSTGGPESSRLFLALWPDERTRDALVAIQGDWAWPAGAVLVPHAKLHVTLHFLGSVPAERLAHLRPALEVRGNRFELVDDGAHSRVWPGGIAVLEPVVPLALQELHGALAGALRGQGFPVEQRRFRPHVTLARRAFGAKAPSAPRPFTWHCDGSWALVRSVPREGYQVVEAHALQ